MANDKFPPMPEDVRRAYNYWRSGNGHRRTMKDVGERMGLSPASVNRICRRWNWYGRMAAEQLAVERQFVKATPVAASEKARKDWWPGKPGRPPLWAVEQGLVEKHREERAERKEQEAAAGGVRSLAEVLNRADRSMEKAIIEKLEETDPDLAEEVKRQRAALREQRAERMALIRQREQAFTAKHRKNVRYVLDRRLPVGTIVCVANPSPYKGVPDADKDFPADARIQVKCRWRKGRWHPYCALDGFCDYQMCVEEHHAERHPDLFKKALDAVHRKWRPRRGPVSVECAMGAFVGKRRSGNGEDAMDHIDAANKMAD